MTLTFDLESGVRVTCDVGSSVPILVFLGFSVLELGLIYATESDVRQTDKQTSDSIALCPRLLGAGV